MSKRLYKYYPEDFGALTVKVLHMDLDFDVYEDYTIVTSQLKIRTLEAIKTLTLNADDLEVQEVSCESFSCTYDYQKEKKFLVITFNQEIPPEQEIIIKTKTTCRPTSNILEGLYYDETPKGCPKQQITQCQQWGFQRIVPCIDDMTAKCTYTTTITGDKRYTNIITNGDVVKERHPAGEGREKIVYHNTVTPMATYLFFLGLGTYATFTQEFEYPDGKTFMLELLVPPGSDENTAQKALSILRDAIQWIHVFTGKDKYVAEEQRHQLWDLLAERDNRKAQGEDVSSLREKIKTLAAPLHMGYKYTGTVYREIAMQNSNFGGMENVGNTTITANRIMPYKDMPDGTFEYMVDVKCHEFYHNLNGSEVTGRSPFEIWLNEAVTVFISNEFLSFCFGEDQIRLGNAQYLLAPASGVLAQDAAAGAMPIEPDGFNDCNELITSVTYVKAPEFVRMIQTVMGKEQFVKGLAAYHAKYKHSNASRADWINAMGEETGQDFTTMAQQWLKQTGYPIVAVDRSYNAEEKKYTLELTQTNEEKVWQFPFVVALCKADGEVIAEKTVWVKEKEETIIFSDVSEPAFVSLNRSYSFFGKVQYGVSEEELLLQVKNDRDIVARYLAWYQLWDKEKMRLLKDEDAPVRAELIDLFFEFLNNEVLMEKVGVNFLTIYESVEDEKYAHKYKELYAVRKRISMAIAKKYSQQLLSLYHKYAATKTSGKTYLEQQAAAIHARRLKNLCLGLLSRIDSSEIQELIKKQIANPTAASDRSVALALYLESSAPDKLAILKEQEDLMKQNLVSWEIFLYLVGGSDAENALELIKEVENSAAFRIDQSNDQRGLYGSFARNKKRSLQTPEGRAFLQESIIKLAPVNEYTTGHLVKTLGYVDKMDPEYHVPLIQLMVNVLDALSVEKTPSVFNTVKRMITELPVAREAYEKEHGKIKGL